MLSLRQMACVAIPVACLAGCASSPKTDFFTLTAVSPTSSAERAGIIVVVGPSEIPRELQRSQLVTRISPTELRLHETARWAGSLNYDVNKILADNLEQLLPVKRVVAYPATPRLPIDYRALVEIRQMDGQLGESITLRGSWTIVTGTEQLVAVDSFNYAVPTDGDGFDALVAAQSTALGRLSESLRDALLAAKAEAADGG